MKVGILTFPNSPSFGASLQMNGLYCALQQLGCEVEIINYKNTYMKDKKHVKFHEKSVVKNAIISALDIPSKYKFNKFEKRMFFFPRKIINEKSDLGIIADRYDYLICGSDQVWNPLITGEDAHYFFDFCNQSEKKISYAASFGVDNIDDSFANKIAPLLHQFKRISVREEQAVEIIKKLMGIECDLVIDPSMLLTQKYWRSLSKNVGNLPEHYIAKFIFNYNENIENKIEELSKETGLPVIIIGGTILSKISNKNYTGPIGPDEWLYIIDNADYVVTDSFHGAAFSIIFHKKLFASLASSTNSRLKTLLKTFKMEDCIIDNFNLSNQVDYSNVQKLMDDRRRLSIDFLRNAMDIEEK